MAAGYEARGQRHVDDAAESAAKGKGTEEAETPGVHHIHHIRIAQADNGGHVVTHHAEANSKPMAMHTFGPGQHHELHQHLEDHMGVEHDHEGYNNNLDEGDSADEGIRNLAEVAYGGSRGN